MSESNAEDRRADGGTSMNPRQLRALAELSLIERYGLPQHLLTAAGLLGALVENARYMAGRHARLAARLNAAAANVAEQAGRIVETIVQAGTLPQHRTAVEPHDVQAIAELSGRERELHEQIGRQVILIRAAAEGMGVDRPGEVTPQALTTST